MGCEVREPPLHRDGNGSLRPAVDGQRRATCGAGSPERKASAEVSTVLFPQLVYLPDLARHRRETCRWRRSVPAHGHRASRRARGAPRRRREELSILVRYELLPTSAVLTINGERLYPRLLEAPRPKSVRDRVHEYRYVPQAPGTCELELLDWYDKVVARHGITFRAELPSRNSSAVEPFRDRVVDGRPLAVVPHVNRHRLARQQKAPLRAGRRKRRRQVGELSESRADEPRMVGIRLGVVSFELESIASALFEEEAAGEQPKTRLVIARLHETGRER